MRCKRCHEPNVSGPHMLPDEPCSGIPRAQINYRAEERRYLEGRDEDGLDRHSIAEDLRGQGYGR